MGSYQFGQRITRLRRPCFVVVTLTASLYIITQSLKCYKFVFDVGDFIEPSGKFIKNVLGWIGLCWTEEIWSLTPVLRKKGVTFEKLVHTWQKKTVADKRGFFRSYEYLRVCLVDPWVLWIASQALNWIWRVFKTQASSSCFLNVS